MNVQRGLLICILLITATTLTLLTPTQAQDDSVHPAVTGAPLSRFTTADFSGSGICANCHSNLWDSRGNNVSIDAHWRSSMMGNAARDPLWQAKVSSESERNPAIADIIEDKCSTCHMPMARTQSVVNGGNTHMFGDGFVSRNNTLHTAAMDGVSCTLCHQVQDKNLGKTAGFSGHYSIDTSTFSPNRAIYGPYTGLFTQNMRGQSGFVPQYGKQMQESEMCATCHTLFTPYLDENGAIAGEFPEQTPYLEWEHSSFSHGNKKQSCQDCHMPETAGTVRISNMPRGRMISSRANFSQHFFVGGNVFMQRLLSANIKDLGLTASTQHFSDTINRTEDLLQRQTANLTIKNLESSSETVSFNVKVENLTGHKFPTGFPSRRAWLEVIVTDGNGKTIFHSGRPKATGKIRGGDGDKKRSKYENHYNVIDNPKQVQIYEGIMGDTTGAVTYTLLKGAQYLKDNRLLPAGFDKKSADDDIGVYGAAAKDSNFNSGFDSVTYNVSTGNSAGPFTVIARLNYQTLAFPFYKDLSTSKTDQVAQFATMYKKVDNLPVLIAEASKKTSN